MTNVPLLITAELAHGIALGHPWGIALDGLLASRLWQRAKTTARTRRMPEPGCRDVPNPPDLPLPLQRCQRGGDWHWAATCAWPVTATGRPPEVRPITAAVDARAMEAIADGLPRNIPTRNGPYRTRRMPLLVIPTPAVMWQAIGDPEQVERLLADIPGIGKRRSGGEGRVLRWRVETSGADDFAAAHLHPDGTLGRPTPAGCLTGRAIIDGGTGAAAIRPPYQHPSRITEARLPVAIDAERPAA